MTLAASDNAFRIVRFRRVVKALRGLSPTVEGFFSDWSAPSWSETAGGFHFAPSFEDASSPTGVVLAGHAVLGLLPSHLPPVPSPEDALDLAR